MASMEMNVDNRSMFFQFPVEIYAITFEEMKRNSKKWFRAGIKQSSESLADDWSSIMSLT